MRGTTVIILIVPQDNYGRLADLAQHALSLLCTEKHQHMKLYETLLKNMQAMFVVEGCLSF